MIGISLAVLVFDYLWRMVFLLTGRKRPFPLVVLAYHSVAPEKRDAFAWQMEQLRNWAKPCRADSGPLSSIGRRPVAISFDDGYQTLLQNVIPEVEARAIPITIFVAPAALGAAPNWTDYSGGTDCVMSEPIMTADQLRGLPQELVQIGSHSVTHPMLTDLGEQDARMELSRTTLEAIVRQTVSIFSFPYGSYNEELVALCRVAGYERVFVTHPNSATSLSDDYVIGRVKVEPEDWPIEFFLKVHGAYRWRNRWRGSVGSRYSCVGKSAAHKGEMIAQQELTRQSRSI